jgi:hypothetical protein
MKRVLLALGILMLGTCVFCSLRHETIQFCQAVAAAQEAWMAQTQRLAQAQIHLANIKERVQGLQADIKSGGGVGNPVPSSPLSALIGKKNLSSEESEQLLAELGFNWNSAGEYLVISKKSLGSIYMESMDGFQLADSACKILAITPGERGLIEAETRQIGADYTAWALDHLQRSEPSGDIVAKYTLPEDPELSQSMSNRFVNTLFSSLGSERAAELLDHSYSWMSDVGMLGGNSSTMTIKSTRMGDDVSLMLELQSKGGNMSCGIAPQQPFPRAFQTIFPNGWRDLAEHEVFVLPKQFQ